VSDFYVVAVCHTIRDHEYITLWRPDDCGYTPVLPRAGRYDYERVMSHLDYYHGGDHIAVRKAVIDALAVPIPDGYFDYSGPGILNTKANWEVIKAALAWPTKYPVKPEWYGKRGRRAA
jgi:hypothetical protein